MKLPWIYHLEHFSKVMTGQSKVNFSDQFTESEWLKFSYKLWLMFKNAYISTYLEVNLDVRVCGLQC